MYLGDGCISEYLRGVMRMRVTLDAIYPLSIRECAAVAALGGGVLKDRSEDILGLFVEACDVIEVYVTRRTPTEIAIYRKASVARLDEFIGPKR